MYNKASYKEREGIYQKIVDRYQQLGLSLDIKSYIQIYQEYQLRAISRILLELYPTQATILRYEQSINIMYILVSKSKPFLVVIRESLLGYLEARALVKADSTSITKFFFKEVIY